MIELPKRVLVTEGAADLRVVPRPPMLIEEIIPEAAIVLVSGPAYSGKTFFALEAARSVALGTPFMGQWNPARRGNVLIVEQDAPRYDMGRALWAMLRKDWEEEGDEHRASEGYSDVDGIRIAWHPGLNLLNRADASAIIETANSLRTFRGVDFRQVPEVTYAEDGSVATIDMVEVEVDHDFHGAALIVLDTMRALHKGEENDSGEMETVIQNLKFIRQQTGAAIIAIAHDNAGGTRTRGSTAWDGGVDSEYNVVGSRKKRHSTVVVRKARAIRPPDFRYTISTTEVGNATYKSVEFKEMLDEQAEEEAKNEPALSGPATLLAYLGSRLESSREEIGDWCGLNGHNVRTVERWLKKFIDEGQVLVRHGSLNGKRIAYYRTKGGASDTGGETKATG